MTALPLMLGNLVICATVFAVWFAWYRASEEAAAKPDKSEDPARTRAAAHEIRHALHRASLAVSALRYTDAHEWPDALDNATENLRFAGGVVGRYLEPCAETRPESSARRVLAIDAMCLDGSGRQGDAFESGSPEVRVESRGDFYYAGDPEDAQVVFQNLLSNAVREATVAGGDVRVTVDTEEIKVTNRVARPETITPAIWEDGVSFWGSTGIGLANTSEAAERLGWRVWNDPVEDGQVTFRVRRV